MSLLTNWKLIDVAADASKKTIEAAQGKPIQSYKLFLKLISGLS